MEESKDNQKVGLSNPDAHWPAVEYLFMYLRHERWAMRAKVATRIFSLADIL